MDNIPPMEGIELRKLMNGTPIDISSFLQIALMLTDVVYTYHKRDTIIGNLNPAGVLIQLERKLVELTDTRITDYAYLSPEQTGRINRTPERCSDLYALGMILYEMLAGSLPFRAQSMEQWVHAHLAMIPIPLSELRSEITGPLEGMIMKLLSKMPEGRYQSAHGLIVDLQRCVSSIEKTGRIVPFEIARADDDSRFQLPNSLFGREAEELQLSKALEQARADTCTFVIVSGGAGSGKTALVHQLQGSVIRAGGRFISGKCELMNRDIPFSPILEALRRLIQQVWSESPESVARLKVQLLEALGRRAGVIAQLLPEAEKLLGKLPSVELLGPAEAAIRFRLLLPIFIQIFAGSGHPLVIFLDDLQWADSATMDTLRTVVLDPTLHGLLLIGTFREEAAPHRIASEDSRATAASWIENSFFLTKMPASLSVQHIALNPLTYIDVRQFVSHIVKENSARIRMLAESLYHRTGGNPLYLHRLLDSLYREKKLYYDDEQANWVWDTVAVTRMPEDPDILHLIGTRIRMLPSDTIELLAVAASIGHRFRLSMVAAASGHSMFHANRLLCVASEEGLISQENDFSETDTDEVCYTFLHDRVQQAAYQTVHETQRADLHLKIGRSMCNLASDSLDDWIFDRVYHLNLGSERMASQAEKRELAAYNLEAALKSQASTAFATAKNLLEKGLRLVENDEQGQNSLAYRLMLELPVCEYMCGRVDRAEELLDQLLLRTVGVVERSRIYLIQISMYAYLKRDRTAVAIGFKALKEIGFLLPAKPSNALIKEEMHLVQIELTSMLNEPELIPSDDPHYIAMSNLVMAISTSVFSLSSERSVVLFSRFIRFSLNDGKGSSEAFAYILALYGVIILRDKIVDAPIGLHYMDAALRIASSFESADLLCKLSYFRGIARLLDQPEESITHFEQSMRYGMESANLIFVSIAALTCVIAHTGDLHTLSARIKNYEDVSRQLLDEVAKNVFRILRWYIAQLQGGAGEGEEVVLPVQNDRFKGTMNNEVSYIYTCKIEIAYLFGRYKEALEWIEQGTFNTARQNWLQARKQHVYHALTLAARYAEAPMEERAGIQARLKKLLRVMKQWSGYYGQNTSVCLLVSAELHRIDGNSLAAAKGYDDAILEARSQNDRLMEAIACERASVFYREAGSRNGADVFMADASVAYSAWGATRKAQRLREDYPGLRFFDAESQSQEDGMAAKGLAGFEKEREKVPTIYDDNVFIIQTLEGMSAGSGENAMHRFLESAISYSGAEKGYLLTSHEEGFTIEKLAGSHKDVRNEVSFVESVVRYVARTGEPVVQGDASRSLCITDSYTHRSLPLSILCMPVLFPGQSWSSVLYLENNLLPGVFSTRTLGVLDLMIARMVYLRSFNHWRQQIRESNDMVSASTLSDQDSRPPVNALTIREMEMLYALADGLSNKEIAYRFGLTEGTVKSYVFNLYGKLGAKRRAQAIAHARERGLLE
ncbi:AAA family ATPase [Cohnella sp. WQ 127256]|uniref:AAA family ATPase n=1 Tax=Cohnella sp. WQ 127256 TaxID=2938790 RepID=UPI00211778C0|nr:AAA family ATPase [Cohnella sp. WQ 127256]